MARRLWRNAVPSNLFTGLGSPAVSQSSDAIAASQATHLCSRVFSTATSSTSAIPASPAFSLPQLSNLLQIYKQLSKARLSALVVSTAAAGFVAGSGHTVCWDTLGWVSLGTMGAAASANALNQSFEVRQDSLMKRTMRRPLPLGQISRAHALGFAAVAGAAGIGILAWQTNWLAAGLGAANIGLYAGVYTPLKMISPANTWVGALVGAIPPLLGWAAASSHLDAGAGIFAGIVYFWQIPHFLSLAWLYRADYARGGYRMLPVLDSTGRRTGACMLRNCLYLIPLGPAAMAAGIAGPSFACIASVATGVFAAMAAAFARTPTSGAARGVFRASLIYLPIVMAAALWDRIPQPSEDPASARADSRHSNEDQLAAEGTSASQDGRSDHGAQRSTQAFMTMPPWPFLPLPAQLGAPPSRAEDANQRRLFADQRHPSPL